MAGLKQSQVQALAAELLAHLKSGKTEDEARETMSLGARRFAKVRALLHDSECERLQSRSPADVYFEYCVDQSRILNRLDDLMQELTESKQANARVGCLRLKSEIHDKVVKLGQDLGLVHRGPEEHRVIGGILVSQLSDDELRQAITKELSGLNHLIETYGNDVNLMDVEPGPLHYELAEKAGKTNRARTARVHRGRRRVRPT